jgi:CheY-like chemotaxis protein
MQTPGKGEHILVVDDESDVCTAILLILRSSGYIVEAVACAEEALAHLEKRECDLVITDNRMSGMSGIELALIIKTCWPWLPIVMFSAAPPEGPIGCLDLVLTKPGDVSLLSKSVRQVLDRAAH